MLMSPGRLACADVEIWTRCPNQEQYVLSKRSVYIFREFGRTKIVAQLSRDCQENQSLVKSTGFSSY